MNQPIRAQAFTLLELLVVITIIVVLLALLTPALDKAVYQAQLAVCASRQHVVAATAVTYALGNNRRYFHRGGARGSTSWRADMINHGNARGAPWDERQLLKKYIKLNGALNDPLSGSVDFETDIAWDGFNRLHLASYDLWFGIQYTSGAKGGAGMFKLGDRLDYTDPVTGRAGRSSLLMADKDLRNPPNAIFETSHPDLDGKMTPYVWQDKTYEGSLFVTTQGTRFTHSLWWLFDGNLRGPVDRNAAYDDGSVARFNGVIHNGDDQMVSVPERQDKTSALLIQIPKE